MAAISKLAQRNERNRKQQYNKEVYDARTKEHICARTTCPNDTVINFKTGKYYVYCASCRQEENLKNRRYR